MARSSKQAPRILGNDSTMSVPLGQPIARRLVELAVLLLRVAALMLLLSPALIGAVLLLG